MTRAQRGTLVAAILGSSVVIVDGSVVYVALPTIGATLPATVIGTLEGQTYVGAAYMATLAAFLILGGALGDYHGRKRIYLVGLLGFGVTSALCGFAPTLEALVLARILQGASGALLVPGALATISHAFDGSARGRAFGLWAAATALVAVLGPPIGGFLVETVGWRAVFIVNLPFVAAAGVAALLWIEESRDPAASGRFDWLGAGVAVVAVGSLTFGAIRGQEEQWQDPLAFGALAVGAVAAVAFPVLMARRPNALVSLGLFRDRSFAAINLATLLIYGAFYASFLFQALFLQGTLGYSPLAAAIVSLPTGVLLAILSTRIGSIAGRIGSRPFLVAGPLVMAASMLWWLRVPASSAAWVASLADLGSLVPPFDVLRDPLPATLGFGFGMALLVAPLTTTVMSSVPASKLGIGSAINNALSRVGQPLVAAAIFLLVSDAFYTTLAGAIPGAAPGSPELRAMFQPLNPPAPDAPLALVETAKEASTQAFKLAAIVMAALCVAGAAVSAIGLSGSLGREPDGAEGLRAG
jgi:EmrB/QacA subfamily drug resistance transporter